MKEAIFAFLVALVIGAFINGFGVGSSAPAPPDQPITQPGGPTTSNSVAETSDAAFDGDVLQSTTPVLVDFYSENCAPCRQMAPVVEQVAGDYADRLKVVKLDVDANPSVTARFNVSTIPTLMIFKNGERGESYTGLVPRAILASAVNKTLQ